MYIMYVNVKGWICQTGVFSDKPYIIELVTMANSSVLVKRVNHTHLMTQRAKRKYTPAWKERDSHLPAEQWTLTALYNTSWIRPLNSSHLSSLPIMPQPPLITQWRQRATLFLISRPTNSDLTVLHLAMTSERYYMKQASRRKQLWTEIGWTFPASFTTTIVWQSFEYLLILSVETNTFNIDSTGGNLDGKVTAYHLTLRGHIAKI